MSRNCQLRGWHSPTGDQQMREVRSAGDTRVTTLLERCAECGVWATPGWPYFGPRFEVRALINGEGFVVVDHSHGGPMVGPYPKSKKGRERAYARAAEFEADPSLVPPAK